MHAHKATFWRIFNIMLTIAVIGLIVAAVLVTTGCATIGTCERLAIAEEMAAYRNGSPVYRVHYYWWDMDEARFRGHARNYLLHPDNTRTYYDVGGVHWVPKPSKGNILYDSYDTRVINGTTNPPVAAPRRGDGRPPQREQGK